MARLVMKFGGTSVADIDHIRNVARHVKREVDAGHEVAVVVSAMSGATNQLIAWCEAALKERRIFDAREYDAVVATGEQVTAGLLAITLQDLDVNARSWQGWQLSILTSDAHGSARILDVNGDELVRRFKERKEVAVIAGFQGVHKETGRITTLGRGGSDTSAVAIAAAIHADRCDIYTDVDGVYTTDPRVVPRAQRLEKVAFEVRTGSCQPSQERALISMSCSVIASRPAVTCSPVATTASYSRASKMPRVFSAASHHLTS